MVESAALVSQANVDLTCAWRRLVNPTGEPQVDENV
jgi:hypothetical protein